VKLDGLAWLDASRRLRIRGMDGTEAPAWEGLTWGAWAEPSAQEVHSWPTWSPDGTHVASFRLGRQEGSMACHVRITDVLGVDAVEVAELTGRLPIYLQWSHDGTSLNILTQDEDVLVLEQAWQDAPGILRRRLTGSPLFFHGTHDAVVAFVGETVDGAQRPPSLLVLGDDGSRLQLAGVPGNFCAPVVLGDEVAYVRIDAGRPELHVAPLCGGPTRKLRSADGLAALLPSPDQRRLAWSVAPDGTGQAYHGLELIDPWTGLSERLTHEHLVAFSWLPDGSGLIVAQRTDEGTVAWSRVGLDGHTRRLGALFPTRDLRFYLRFFEQFALSHPLVSPDGSHLVVAGGWVDRDDPRGTPRLWAVPIEGGDAEPIADGVFATFAPAAQPERPDEETPDGRS
jgi:hypothetical protein